MKLLKVALATMEVVRQLQVLFRERDPERTTARKRKLTISEDPETITQTPTSNRRKRR